MRKDLFIGTLRSDSHLQTDLGGILLTGIAQAAGRSPDSERLEIPSEKVGRMAIVRGDESEGILYSAEIVEVFTPIASALFSTLVKKGLISLDELKKQIEDPQFEGIPGDKPRRLCALVIGHKRRSPGAVNLSQNLSEFDFNDDFAMRIERKVQETEIQRVYRRTYRELPEDINALGPHFIVSLHCNAFDGRVSGTEVLYYHKSERGKEIAEILQRNLVEFLKLPDRGVKPRTSEDRGGYLLKYTKAPCVIAEPFFIDNDGDLARAQENVEELAAVYAKAIDRISQIV